MPGESLLESVDFEEVVKRFQEVRIRGTDFGRSYKSPYQRLRLEVLNIQRLRGTGFPCLPFGCGKGGLGLFAHPRDCRRKVLYLHHVLLDRVGVSLDNLLMCRIESHTLLVKRIYEGATTVQLRMQPFNLVLQKGYKGGFIPRRCSLDRRRTPRGTCICI